MVKMPNKKQDKVKKQPTIWHAIGVGILLGVLPLLILLNMLATPRSLIDFLGLITDGWWIVWLFLSFACAIGAFIGKIRGKSFKAFWIGAIIGLVVGTCIGVVAIYWAFVTKM